MHSAVASKVLGVWLNQVSHAAFLKPFESASLVGCMNLNALMASCRHLQRRLGPQMSNKQQASVSAPSSQRGTGLSDGAARPATSPNKVHSSEAGQGMQRPAGLIPSKAAQRDSGQGKPCAVGQGADEACGASQPTDQRRATMRAAKLCSAAQDVGHANYLQGKQVPWLTGWWEYTCAFMAVFLLPLISIVPFSTTAERPDSHFGQP